MTKLDAKYSKAVSDLRRQEGRLLRTMHAWEKAKRTVARLEKAVDGPAPTKAAEKDFDDSLEAL